MSNTWTLEHLKLPEGMSLPPEEMSRILEVMNSSNSIGDAVNGLINLAYDLSRSAARAAEERVKSERESWRKKIVEDKVFGGERLEETQRAIAQVRTEFFGREFDEVLAASGLGDHPAVFFGLAKVASKLAEPRSPVTGNARQTVATTPSDVAKMMFGAT